LGKNPRVQGTHRGVVLGIGAPAQVNGHDVPHGFTVGDEVQFHFEHHEGAMTRLWPDDGEMAIWLPQSSVDAVWE
jgi:diadenosine tetraphosphatase ApaH/serine/threonine PP2A family protein phosphatase